MRLPAPIFGLLGICSFRFKQNVGYTLLAGVKSLNFVAVCNHSREAQSLQQVTIPNPPL